jgi:hypothetical protein
VAQFLVASFWFLVGDAEQRAKCSAADRGRAGLVFGCEVK